MYVESVEQAVERFIETGECKVNQRELVSKIDRELEKRNLANNLYNSSRDWTFRSN